MVRQERGYIQRLSDLLSLCHILGAADDILPLFLRLSPLSHGLFQDSCHFHIIRQQSAVLKRIL